MDAARGRLEQAMSYADAGSDAEMRLRAALGGVLWYSDPESNAIEPAFALAPEIAKRTDATDVETQARICGLLRQGSWPTGRLLTRICSRGLGRWLAMQLPAGS
jgi:hypothetical protein